MKRSDVLEQAKSIRLTVDEAAGMLTDQQAAKVKTLYPEWVPGEVVEVGDRRYYPPSDLLYKAIQAHTTQSDWTPDATPALWSVLDVEHAGTQEDPIPAAAGMEYVKGKYYVEDGIIYLMNRTGMPNGEGIVLQYLPSQLIGQYFETVQ